jgi:acetyl esterase/lipase
MALAALVAMATAACSKLSFIAANVPAAFGPYKRKRNVAFGSHPEHRLDIYSPELPAATSRPLVVFWYGGRWENGDKDDYRFVGAALAQIGAVAVLPNYRHYPLVKMPGFMGDAALAVGWAALYAAELGADPSRVYLMGHSAGAHIAALLALNEHYLEVPGRPALPIAGMIGLSGPYDFLPLEDPDLQDMFGPPDLYPDSQPIHFVRPGAPPMLLLHGLADQTVRPRNSVHFAAALQAQGVAVRLKTYPGLGHADTVAALSVPARRRAPVLAEIAAFVQPAGSAGRTHPEAALCTGVVEAQVETLLAVGTCDEVP